LTAPNKKQVSKTQKQKAALRASLWPDLDENRLWAYKTTGGWLNIPRAMPLLLRIMDTMSKGKPISQTYLDLWCRTYNDSFVIANKRTEMAFYSGFDGERAVRTWADRIAILRTLGFIEILDGPSGPISYILILNPFHVLKGHHAKGRIDSKSYHALIERLIETGTDELAEPEAEATTNAEAETATATEETIPTPPSAPTSPAGPRWRRPIRRSPPAPSTASPTSA